MSKLDDYTKEELIDKLSRIYDRPHIAQTINMLIGKIEEINNSFDGITIDVTSDEDKSFSNFVSFGEKVVKINTTINTLLESIDPNERAEIAARQAQAKDTSLEALMKAAREKKNNK